MVSLAALASPWILVWAATEAQPAIRKLDGATRARVLAALAGLIILGFAMVLLTWLGARVVRRYTDRAHIFRPTAVDDAWAGKPLAVADDLGDGPADERSEEASDDDR